LQCIAQENNARLDLLLGSTVPWIRLCTPSVC